MLANQPKFKYLLLVVDILVISISLVFAFFGGGKEAPGVGEGRIIFYVYYFSTAGIALMACLFSLLYNDLYKRNILITRHRQTILLVKSMLISCALVLLAAAIFQHASLASYGRRFIGIYFVLATVLLFSYRVLLVTPLMRAAAKKRIASRRLLIVGARAAGQHVALSLCNDSCSNFNVVGFLDDYMEIGEEVPVDGVEPADHLHNLGQLGDLDLVVKQHQIDEILIAIDNVGYERLIHIVDRCLATGKVLRVYSDFLKVIAEKMRIEFYSDIPVIMLSQVAADGLSWKIKRLFDIVSSSFALILLAPFFLLIALGIKLSSPGPVFFAQERIGKGGKPFKFYKFRSMHVSSDSSNHKEFVQNFIKGGGDKKDQCDTEIRVFKITDDPRIFKLGAFIRKTSIDEFPQLYNVIRGDMSVVGPRPCLQYEWDCYDEWHKNRLNILPGCSGLWQALGRSTVSFQEMVILDLYYVSNMSLWLDIKIILLTFPVIFLGKGAF